MVTDMEVHMVADMEVDKVADKEADLVVDVEAIKKKDLAYRTPLDMANWSHIQISTPFLPNEHFKTFLSVSRFFRNGRRR